MPSAYPPLATIEDLQVRIGVDVPMDDVDQAGQLLRYASALVRGWTGRTWVDDGGDLVDVPLSVIDVVVEIVHRSVVNPDGATQQTAGPFSVSFGRDAAQRMFLTRSDKTILAGLDGVGAAGRAFTIDTMPNRAYEFRYPPYPLVVSP